MTHLAWLYWDPNPIFFIVPFLNHPIYKYGVCFVLGFIFGFFIIRHLILEKLRQTKTLSARDIVNWSVLLQLLQKTDGNPRIQLIRQKFSAKTRQELDRLDPAKPLNSHLKESILTALNSSLEDPTLKFDRHELEQLFPTAIRPLSDLSFLLIDRMAWFVVTGTLVGSRLGHVFLYDWPRYKDHLWDIFKIWEGGLASHGGILGVIIALYAYSRFIRKIAPEISFVTLLDLVCIPSSLVGCFIRIGNFYNQEIFGTETRVPWAVIFGHPIDRGAVVPRHPVQLYEALSYLLIFFLLYGLWRFKSQALRPGMLVGLFFVLMSISRIVIEFWKIPQSFMIDESFLQTGQYLSLPFLLLGIFFLVWGQRSKKHEVHS
jgi:phosphatidylglycerol:prolipoprotein diacylglycerol transferase